MAKRIFFSFHYQDVIDFRANVVRNHWMTKPNRASAGFFDASVWEEAKKKGDAEIKRLINSAIKNTSVICVLIGTLTHLRKWVRYEIMKGLKVGNLILGVHINSIKGKDKKTKPLGRNPLDYLCVGFSDTGVTATLYEWKNGKWQKYTEVDGNASWQIDAVEEKYRGKEFQLSKIFSTYDWDKSNGYNNFSNWVN